MDRIAAMLGGEPVYDATASLFGQRLVFTPRVTPPRTTIETILAEVQAEADRRHGDIVARLLDDTAVFDAMVHWAIDSNPTYEYRSAIAVARQLGLQEEDVKNSINRLFAAGRIVQSQGNETHYATPQRLTIAQHRERFAKNFAEFWEHARNDNDRGFRVYRPPKRFINEGGQELPEESDVESLFDKYMDHMKAYLQKERVWHIPSAKRIDPSEKLMRAVEVRLDIPEQAAHDFRKSVEELFKHRWLKITSKDHLRLRRAIMAVLNDQGMDQWAQC
jgi:hypothetical protein